MKFHLNFYCILPNLTFQKFIDTCEHVQLYMYVYYRYVFSQITDYTDLLNEIMQILVIVLLYYERSN